MLIPIAQLRRVWGLHPSTVLHVGAHNGEEREDYLSSGWGSERTVWVEADEALARALSARLADFPEQTVVCGVAWHEPDVTVEFHVLSNTQASSVLAPSELLDVYRDIEELQTMSRTTTTLERIAIATGLQRIDLINLDIQGAELSALRGLGDLISHVGSVYAEINTRRLYRDVPLLPEVDNYLEGHGFRRVDLVMAGRRVGWGDALWIREEMLPRFLWLRRLLRRALRGAHLTWYATRVAGHWMRMKTRGLLGAQG